MKKIAIIGASGFGQEVYCVWKDMLDANEESFQFIGFFDDAAKIPVNKFGNVVGKVSDLNAIDYNLEVAIAIGTPKHIRSVKSKITNSHITFPNIIHPSVKFLGEETITMGNGNIFSLDVQVSCNVTIGNFNIFNTRTTLAHDDFLCDYNVLSPNVQISGNVSISNCNFFGFNCGVIQGVKIGNDNVIGAGSILLRSIKDEGTYFGLPAAKMKI